MLERFDSETKSKYISLLLAALITAILAVPYFYYQYFYDPKVNIKEESRQNVTANVSNPIKSTFETLKALLQGDLSGESVYRQE